MFDDYDHIESIIKKKVLKKVERSEIINGTYVIPSNIEIIGDYAFGDLDELEKIVIHDNVREIGNNAFSECQNLREVIMSKNIKKIGCDAFAYCYSLRNLVIPKSIKYIGNDVCYACENLNLILKTSLFKFLKNNYGFYFNVGGFKKLKTITIYDRIFTEEGNIYDDTFKPIRKRELTQILINMLTKQGIPFRNLYKDFPDSEGFIDSIVTKFDNMDDNYDYHTDLQNYINDYLSKNSIVVKVFKEPTIFEGQTRNQIYDFVNNYVPSEVNFKDINEVMSYSKTLEDYPTYISGEFLNALSKKINFNPEVKQIIKFLNNISKSVNGKNILKRLFFKKSETSGELSLDTQALNNMNSFIKDKLDDLSSEIELFEFLKKIIRLYTEKRNEQVSILNSQTNEIDINTEPKNDYEEVFNSSDNLASNTSVNSEIDKLNISIVSMVEQYKKVNILLSYDIVIYNKLTSLLKDVIPNLIANVALDNGISQRKDILEDIETIKNVFNDMILGENKQKISSNSEILELKLQVDEMIEEEMPKVKVNKK